MRITVKKNRQRQVFTKEMLIRNRQMMGSEICKDCLVDSVCSDMCEKFKVKLKSKNDYETFNKEYKCDFRKARITASQGYEPNYNVKSL